MSNITDRKTDFDSCYDESWSVWGTWQAEAKKDLQAYLKNAWTANELRQFKEEGREAYSVPLIRRNVKLISNYERKSRLSIKFDPMEGGDENTASQLTAVGLWAMQLANGHNVISNAFEGAMITGINLVDIYRDSQNVIKFCRYPYNQFLLDPQFTEIDLSDCQYGIFRKLVNREEAKIILPKFEDEIDAITLKDEAHGGKFPNITDMRIKKTRGRELLALDYWWQRTTRKQKYVIILQNGQPMQAQKWDGSDKNLNILQQRFRDQIKVITQYEPSVELTVYIEGEEITNEIDPHKVGDFSFTPIVGFYHPEGDQMTDKLQGVVRGLRDCQKINDRRIMHLLGTMEMQIGSGVDVEETALVDKADAYKSGSGAVRWLKDGAIQNQKIRDRQIPPIPAGMVETQQLFENLMPKTLNLGEELFGMPENPNLEVAGELAKMRAANSIVGIRDLYDNLSLSKKCIGTKLLKFIQQFNPQEIQRILNEQPTGEFYTRDFGKYDCAVVEGMLTDTQRQMFYAELINLKKMGATINDPPPVSWDTIFKYLPVQITKDLKKDLQKRSQMQEMIKQLQLKDQQLSQQLKMSKMQADLARSTEMISRSESNRANAAFERIKAMLELKNMDKNEHFDKFMELMKMVLELEHLESDTKQGQHDRGMDIMNFAQQQQQNQQAQQPEQGAQDANVG
jgi:hypothetical protein